MTVEQPHYTTSSTHNYKRQFMQKFTWKDYLKAALMWFVLISVSTILIGSLVKFIVWLFKLGYTGFGLL